MNAMQSTAQAAPHTSKPRTRLGIFALETTQKAGEMVGGTGIEPVTTAMSTQCSTAELTAHPSAHGQLPVRRG